MRDFPDFPFLTEDFSPRGGGIDFLGLRQVNLAILGDHLIPGINNVTSDMGTYCIATWIPWKFSTLCRNKKDFTAKKYEKYREAIEVAIAHAMRDGSPSCNEYGKPANRVGVQQKLSLPCRLGFAKANRTNTTSIYQAAFYGPSLQFLGLLSRNALAEDGSSINIHVAEQDEDTQTIVESVDKILKESISYEIINNMDIQLVTEEQLDDLGMHGLNPSYFRQHDDRLKMAFAHKLLPEPNDERANGRMLTARLIVSTLQQSGPVDLEGLRAMWHTGLTPNGERIILHDPELENQRELWSIFQGRQYQRYILELFLRCFEISLVEGCRSIEEIVEYWIFELEPVGQGSPPANFEQVLYAESKWFGDHLTFAEISDAWNRLVHGEHHAYDWIDEDDTRKECTRAIKMLARWWLRSLRWIEEYKNKELLSLGGRDRISIEWLSRWVDGRRTIPLRDLLKDIFSDLVFSQHIRVALYRFDGEVQRLRFALGDEGIVPTTSAASKIGEGSPPWMEDRVKSFVSLLCDLSILRQDENGLISLPG